MKRSDLATTAGAALAFARRRSDLVALAALILFFAGGALFQWASTPTRAPLLVAATTTGGGVGLCGSPWDGPIDGYDENGSHSPEMRERLRRDFPPGTAEVRLIAELQRQGFTVSRCPEAPSVGLATIRQKTGSAMVATEVEGNVSWKVDAQKRIVWTNGRVFYSGL